MVEALPGCAVLAFDPLNIGPPDPCGHDLARDPDDGDGDADKAETA